MVQAVGPQSPPYYQLLAAVSRAVRREWPFAAIAVALALLVARFWASPPYSTDSWAYFELSRSLWSDGYVLGGLRDFDSSTLTAPSASFPPLWPLLWSVVSAVTGSGARSGLLLSGTAVFVLALLSEAICRSLTGARWIGTTAALFVLFTPGFFDEMVGGRTIPAQLALTAAACWCALRCDPRTSRHSAVLGALGGVLVMLRFDMLPFAIVLGAGLVLHTRSLRPGTAYFATLLLTIAPWIIVSREYHGVWFASDNLSVALSADPERHAANWYLPGEEPPTAFERPGAFVAKVAGNVPQLLWRMPRSVGRYGAMMMLGVSVLLILAAVARRRALLAAFRAQGVEPNARKQLSVLMLFVAAAVAMLPAYLFSGYFADRYFSLVTWLTCLGMGWALTIAARVVVPWVALERVSLAASGILLVVIMLTKGVYGADVTFPDVRGGQRLAVCVSADSTSRVLALPSVLAARLSAVHGIRTSLTPANLRRHPPTAEMARAFFRTFGIAFVTGEPDSIAAIIPPAVLELAGTDCGLVLYGVR